MFTIIISQSKSKVNTNIKIAIDGSRMASIYDWISRCPHFACPRLFASAQKTDRFNSAASLYLSPDSTLNTPKIRSSFNAFAEQSCLFSSLFSLIFSLETTILEKKEERREKSEKNKKKRQSSVENCRFFLAEKVRCPQFPTRVFIVSLLFSWNSVIRICF